MDMNYLGKALIIFGIVLVVVGVFFTVGGKIPWLGRLPGDIIIEKKNFSFYFPLTTCILISIALSVFYFLFFRK